MGDRPGAPRPKCRICGRRILKIGDRWEHLTQRQNWNHTAVSGMSTIRPPGSRLNG